MKTCQEKTERRRFRVVFPDGTKDIVRSTVLPFKYSIIALTTHKGMRGDPKNGDPYWTLQGNSASPEGAKRMYKLAKSDKANLKVKTIHMKWLDEVTK